MSRKKFGGFFDNPGSRLKKPKAQTEVEYANNEHEPDTWTDIAIHDSFAVALGNDSKVYTWGDNAHGQLGLSTAYDNDKDSHSWVSVGSGWSFYGALRADGSIWAWGNNAYGQLGQNDRIHRSSPIQVAADYSWRKIAVGGHMMWGIREDGYLFGWGRNANGELAQNDRTDRLSPTQITTWKWNDLAGGRNHFIAIRDDNTLWGCGFNAQGQVGDATATARSSIVQVNASAIWDKVYAGWSNSFAIRSGVPRLYVWGFNTSGQLGLGNVLTTYTTAGSHQLAGSWSFIKASYHNTVGQKTDGTLWSWGNNAYGQLGEPSRASNSSPIQISTRPSFSDKTIVDALPTFESALYRDNEGGIWSIGRNFAGELAHDAYPFTTQSTDGLVNRSSPSQIGTNFRLETPGISCAMVLSRDDETLWAWGHNVFGELGLNDINIHRSSPVQINYIENSKDRPNRTLTNQNVKAIAAGSSHALAINNDGKLYGWGSRQAIDSKTYAKSWTKVSVGQYHTMAIASDGSMWAWGDNDNGQLGLGDIINRSSPVQVPTNTSWVNVKAAVNYTLAIDNEGAMWGWGLGTSGQINSADGNDWRTYGGKSDPGQVRAQEISPAVTKSWTKVAYGRSFTIAIKSDGTLWSWGANDAGQLGTGNTLGQSSPTQIMTGFSNWADVDAGDQHWAAVRSTGHVVGCGRNTEGQLGQGNIVNYSSPVQISTAGTSLRVATGGYTTFFKRNTGIWYGVGRNTSGELGISDVASRSAIVTVGAAGVYDDIIGAYTTTYMLKSNGQLWGTGAGSTGQLPHYDATDLGLAAVHMSSPTQVGVGEYTKSWTMIANGNPYSQHMAAIRSDGVLFTWGLNTNGQLGTGNIASYSSPVQVLSNCVDVALGEQHTMAINNLGRLYVTGLNDQGQLGISNVLPRSALTQVAGSWTTIAAGARFSLGRKTDGNLYAWGDNTTYGQLGNGTTIDQSSPIVIGAYNIQDIDCGIHHTLMTTTDGKLWAWGRNDYGQLGVLGNGHVISYSEPVQIYSTPQENTFTEFNGGIDFTLARDSANVLWGWGLGTNGRLGQGNVISQSSPVQIVTDLAVGENKFAASRLTAYYINSSGALFAIGGNNHGQIGNSLVANVSSPTQVGSDSWVQVVSQATASHVVAIRSDGSLWAWGRNNYGQLGDGTIASRSSPIQIGSDTDWTWVDAGQEHSLAKKTDGSLWGWGRNDFGHLAVSDVINRSSPVQISVSLTQIATGAHHSYGISETGELFAWGYNNVGRLGIGSTANQSSPVQISGSWTQVAAGGNFGFAVKDNGQLFAWGGGASGQLGQRNVSNYNSPVLVLARNRAYGETKSWTLSSKKLGDTTSFAIDQDGDPWVWGLGTSGQLGDMGAGIITHVSSPTQIGLRETWSKVGAGQLHSGAITSNGHLYMWGRGFFGATALGPVVGMTASVSEPVQIGRMEDQNESWTTQIATGQYTSYAIRHDGALFAWGWNDNGQLAQKVTGATNSQNRSSPVQIGIGESWSQVAANYLFAGAIKDDGTLWMWGSNATGQLGDGSSTQRNSPVQVAGGGSWNMVALMRSSTVAIKSDGTLWSWGNNTYGQLGDGTTVNKNSPVQIGPDTDWQYVATGNFEVNALKTDGSLWGWGRGSRHGVGTANLSSPVAIKSGWSWNQITRGAEFGLGIRDDNTLWAWGIGSSGQFGHGFILNRVSPIQIGYDSWTYVSAAYTSSFGIRDNGKLYAWGVNTNGMLGTGNTLNTSSPVQVGYPYLSDKTSFRGGDTGFEFEKFSWAKISSFISHTMGVTTDGKLYVWGRGSEGQLAYCRGDNLDRSSPVQVDTNSWTLIKASRSGTVALRSTGEVFNWGIGSTGENGNGIIASQSSPVLARALQYSIGSDNHTSWTSIDSGGYTKYAIDTTGILHAWGINTNGEAALPRRGVADNLSSPVLLATGKSFVQVRSGQNFALGLTTDGTIWTWGQNAQGQLGHNNVLLLSSPVQLGNKSAWLGVGTARYVGFATEANTLYTWGIGSSGILGLGERTYVVPEAVGTPNRSSPIQIATRNTGIVPWGTTLNTKSGGGFAEHIAVIDTEGSLFSWGRNSHNQTGQPSNAFMISRSSPVQVANYQRYHSDGKPYKKSWIQIAAGTTSAFGLTHDNLLFGWGNNAWGQFSVIWSEYVSGSAGTGSGYVINQSSPVQIGLFDNNSNPQISDPSNPDTQFRSNSENLSWSEIGASSSALHAIRADGTLWNCGLNNYGQYGDGGRTARSSIVQLGSLSNYAHVSAENSTMGVIKTDGTLWMTGYGGLGGIGDGFAINRSTIIQIGADSDWYDLSVGWQHTIGQKTDGTLYGWGGNDASRGAALGVGNQINYSSPVQIGTLQWKINPNRGTGLTFSAGTYFSAAIRGDEYGSNNLLYVWGRNAEGQIGTGTTAIARYSSPTQVGLNEMSGEKTLNNGRYVNYPTKIGDLNYTDVAAGENFTVAISNDKMYSWGENVDGQLGNPVANTDQVEYYSPVLISTTEDFKEVVVGYNRGAAIKK